MELYLSIIHKLLRLHPSHHADAPILPQKPAVQSGANCCTGHQFDLHAANILTQEQTAAVVFTQIQT